MSGLVNPFAETTTFVYDIAGHEARRVTACGVTVSHTYDAAGCDSHDRPEPALADALCPASPVGGGVLCLTRQACQYDSGG